MKLPELQMNRSYLVVLIAVVGSVLLTEYLMDAVWKARYQGWGDFRAYYNAAVAFRTGQDIYDIRVLNNVWEQIGGKSLKPESIGYLYPPLFAVAIASLTSLPFLVAVRVWLVFNALLWLVGLFLVFAFLDLRPRHILFWVLLLVAFRFEPALWTLTVGQVNILVFVLVMVSLHSLKQRRPIPAGLFLAAASILKLTPLILVGYLLFRRQYRTVLWTGGFALVLLGISCIFAGVPAHLKFIQETLPTLSGGVINAYNQSFTGWFLRLFEAAGWTGRLEWARLLARLTGAIFIVITIVHFWRRARPAAGYHPVEISLCILLASLISPITWSHHLVWVILPLAVAFRAIADTGVSWTGFGLLLAATIAVGIIDDYYVHPIFRSGPLVLVSSIKLYGLLVFYVFLLRIAPEKPTVQEAGGTL